MAFFDENWLISFQLLLTQDKLHNSMGNQIKTYLGGKAWNSSVPFVAKNLSIGTD